MSIIKNIRNQVHELLEQNNDIKILQEKLNNLVPSSETISVFPSLNEVESQQPELVFISLTVQDILDTEYYYSYLIKKPVSKDSDICVLKYGFRAKQYENINLQDYEAIMQARETLVCISDFYQTSWIQNQWKGPANIQNYVRVKVSGKQEFRLGQKINAVCLWDPNEKHLIFIRSATSQEIEKHKLNYDLAKSKQYINVEVARNRLIEGLESFCTKSQALMVLYSMISEEPMFINGQNISEQISQLLPRVCHVKIKAPFKKSLFPYKNNEGELVQTPMQMSTAKTFVIIDFSEFSNEKEIKIDQAQIDNLKALKMFVEEGRTIYRWQYGESILDHVHSGIIVKGSKIISPNFHLGEELIGYKSQKNPFKEMEKENKQEIRDYLKMSLEKNPKLSEQARKSIQIDLKAHSGKEPSKLMLQERMQIARLNAKSFCKEFIDFEDYQLAGKLLGLDQ